jgi:release factor glutamine methyltransferase
MEKDPPTIKKIIHDLKKDLSGLYEEREIDQMAAILFRHFTGWNRAEMVVRGEERAEDVLVEKISTAVEELKSFRPIQYIIGMTSFRDLELIVRPGVLIPRPETEELVGLVIAENSHLQLQEFSVLDIGTGSGCIAIALKKMFSYARVDALDISPEALGIAAGNAELNNTEVRFIELDILNEKASGTLPGYQLIVSNPPYVTGSERREMKANVTVYEPPEALFVPDDDPLLFYRAIGIFAIRHLVRPGNLYFEINERFGPEVKKMMLSLGFDRAEVIRDLSGKDRFVRAEAKHTMSDTSYWMVDKQLPRPTSAEAQGFHFA